MTEQNNNASEDSTTNEQQNKKKSKQDSKTSKMFSRRNFFTLAGVASIATGGFFFYNFTQEQQELSTAPKDMEGNAISLDIPLNNTEIEQMDIEPLSQTHITIKELGLDSPLSTMNTVEGIINPPDATRTFLLKDYGTTLDKPAEGTLYTVAHSLKSGIGPGNYLFDWKNDKILVKEGQTITINDLHYKINTVDLVKKTKIGDHETIWKNDPNKLVFITCLQRKEGRSKQNLIVIADRIEVE